MAERQVTVNDPLAGQEALDLECPDRVYLNGYMSNLQVAGAQEHARVASVRAWHAGAGVPQFAVRRCA